MLFIEVVVATGLEMRVLFNNLLTYQFFELLKFTLDLLPHPVKKGY